MPVDQRISELIQRTPNGQEFFEVIIPPFTPGTNRKVLLSDLAAILGGSVPDADATTKGIVEVAAMSEIVAGTDVGGTGAALSVLPSQLGITRTVTGAAADVQTDHNGLIIFNSATPFNFTLDQLLAKTKITFINYGAGAVTFIAGSGVTITGDVALDAVDGDNFASAFVIYDTLTTPRVVKGISLTSSGRIASTITADVLAIDFLNRKIINFDITTTRTTAFSITFANETNLVESNLSMRLTGAIAITLPSAVVMGFIEKVNGRWDESTNILTLTGTTASVFMIQFIPDSAGNIVCVASDRNL